MQIKHDIVNESSGSLISESGELIPIENPRSRANPFIKQKGPFGKYVPNSIKNQMWNLKSFSSASMHIRAGHGYNYAGEQGYKLLGQLWYGTPSWPKLFISSYGGRIIGGQINENIDGEE